MSSSRKAGGRLLRVPAELWAVVGLTAIAALAFKVYLNCHLAFSAYFFCPRRPF